MASRLFRRLSGDLVTINGQQVRGGRWNRGKPPGIARSLEQRLEELNWKDPEIAYRVDIGYKAQSIKRSKIVAGWVEQMKKMRADPEMERMARNIQLRIDLDKTKLEWLKLNGPQHTQIIADHYGVYEHLFGDAYFMPIVPLDVNYDLGEDLVAKVFRGNLMKPRETAKVPGVEYEAAPGSLWTLLLTTPDGNLVNSENEICHWFIGNIPESDLSKGELLMDYMRPIPARGIGYCRYIFVLYKQEGKVDYSEYKKEQPCLSLVERNWSTLDFYRKHQDVITPAGLAFFQADWDATLSEFYRNTLEMQEPWFEYDFQAPYISPQVWFPRREPFNLYLDKYRDPKDINRDFLLKKLKKIHPFRPDEPPPKYPNAHSLPKDMPSWLKLETKKERLGWGRVNEIA